MEPFCVSSAAPPPAAPTIPRLPCQFHGTLWKRTTPARLEEPFANVVDERASIRWRSNQAFSNVWQPSRRGSEIASSSAVAMLQQSKLCTFSPLDEKLLQRALSYKWWLPHSCHTGVTILPQVQQLPQTYCFLSPALLTYAPLSHPMSDLNKQSLWLDPNLPQPKIPPATNGTCEWTNPPSNLDVWRRADYCHLVDNKFTFFCEWTPHSFWSLETIHGATNCCWLHLIHRKGKKYWIISHYLLSVSLDSEFSITNMNDILPV